MPKPSNSKYSKKRDYKKKTYKKSMYSKKKNILQQVDTGFGPELKSTDTTNNSTLASGAAGAWSTAVLLNGTSQGVGNFQRIGRKMIMKSLLVRAKMFTAQNPGRLLVVYDKQPNAVAPAITDIVNADGISSTTNLNQADRFVILADELIDPGNFLGGAGSYCHIPTIYRKFNLETVFGNTGGAIADINSGSVYMFWVAGAATDIITYSTRIRYIDN